jgi:uncharacterized protein YbjT (DUF2867 family)
MTRVLVTGATGYIGRRLKRRLLADRDLHLRLLVRNRRKAAEPAASPIEIVEGDTFNPEALSRAVAGIDVAFYLIHSMGAGRDFEQLDRQSAENFREACIAAGVRRIIYLGGLGVKKTASRHLRSRLETGEILSARPEAIQTLWFRAGVIIGSGSASFEIIRNLVQKLPVMITPRWVNTQTQPIGVGDVLTYLEEAVHLQAAGNLVIDIGANRMTFRQMLHTTARVMELKRLIIGVPVLSPRLSSYWLVLFTPVPYRVAAALVEGLRSETVKQNDNARRYFPEIVPGSYGQAVLTAIAEIENEQVVSRWCDSSGGAVCDVQGHDELARAVFVDCRSRNFGELPAARVFRAATGVGGRAGWFSYNYLWSLRGFLDKVAGGYGLNRGRRHERELRVGDALDFWKVVDLVPDKRLLLLAQMKVPGKAWLEFVIRDQTLVQTAYFHPKGVWGRLYWYAVSPLHALVFQDLAEKIVEEAGKPDAKEKNGEERQNFE